NGIPMVTRSLRKTLRPLSSAYRSKARALYRARHQGERFDRARLEQCLFEVQESIEWMPAYQAGEGAYRRLKPLGEAIGAVRNLLLDALGVNEGEQMNRLRARGGRPPLQWPRVDAVASIVAEKRRKAPRVGFVKQATPAREVA